MDNDDRTDKYMFYNKNNDNFEELFLFDIQGIMEDKVLVMVRVILFLVQKEEIYIGSHKVNKKYLLLLGQL